MDENSHGAVPMERVIQQTPGIGYALVVLAMASITGGLIAVRPHLSLATVALLYLLVVFLTASQLGRGPSLLASLLAVLAANYFFTVPFNTFVVAAPQDVLALLVFLVVAETTSRMAARQQKAAEAEILRKTDELKSILLSAVSHDLRTPLSSIRVAATALLQRNVQWGDDVRRDLLQMIDSEAARLSRLVGNLLDLSRIEAGALRPLKEPQDVQEVVARAVDAAGDRLQTHPVRVDVDPHTPLVPLDFTMIENVLINLLDNAGRNAPDGSQIRIEARPAGGDVIVRIENDGPGIPAAIAGQIFNRFATAQEGRQGTGLGLAICKGLIEAHGGRIWVDRPGEPGARFAFSLPSEDLHRADGRQGMAR